MKTFSTETAIFKAKECISLKLKTIHGSEVIALGNV
jgi:hypothetical protein